MNRSEFLKMLGVGSALAYVPTGLIKKDEGRIVTKDPGKDYEELYQILKGGKPVEIGGIQFVLTEVNFKMDQDQFGRGGRKSIDLSLTSNMSNTSYRLKVGRSE